eukprot:261360-Prymnesium_polylepis.1
MERSQSDRRLPTTDTPSHEPPQFLCVFGVRCDWPVPENACRRCRRLRRGRHCRAAADTAACAQRRADRPRPLNADDGGSFAAAVAGRSSRPVRVHGAGARSALAPYLPEDEPWRARRAAASHGRTRAGGCAAEASQGGARTGRHGHVGLGCASGARAGGAGVAAEPDSRVH